jgi:hypothetical protein
MITMTKVDPEPTTPEPTARTPRGAGAFYVAAVLSMTVSVNTSWRFFGTVLGISNIPERAVMFAVLEVGLLACGYAMADSVRRSGAPGPARMVAWLLCAVSAFMAWQLSGPLPGTARVILGPLFGLIFLHLALGIEVRANHTTHTGTLARIARELRERVLSRVGLADDDRDAAARTRDRNALTVARLAARRHLGPIGRRRQAKAFARSGMSGDVTKRTAMLSELSGLRSLDTLSRLELPSIWETSVSADGATTGATVPDNPTTMPDSMPHSAPEPEDNGDSVRADKGGRPPGNLPTSGDTPESAARTKSGTSTTLSVVPGSRADLVRQMRREGITDPDLIQAEAVRVFGSASMSTIKRALRRADAATRTHRDGAYL